MKAKVNCLPYIYLIFYALVFSYNFLTLEEKKKEKRFTSVIKKSNFLTLTEALMGHGR
jgi:hypothetical protein